jgi:hypothetical protein
MDPRNMVMQPGRHSTRPNADSKASEKMFKNATRDGTSGEHQRLERIRAEHVLSKLNDEKYSHTYKINKTTPGCDSN